MEEISKALLSAGPGGLIASLLFYFYRGKQLELDRANTKIDELQAKIVSILTMQLEAEPARKETLSAIARSISDQSAFLKDRLRGAQ